MDERKPLDTGLHKFLFPLQDYAAEIPREMRCSAQGRGLHSSIFQLNLSRF